MKIKKGKLNYDQSGRAYPPNPRVKENWDCIWEYEGKYYKLVGDNEHKEWDEVNIYNQIINEAYENYVKQNVKFPDKSIFFYGVWGTPGTFLEPPRHFPDHYIFQNSFDKSCP